MVTPSAVGVLEPASPSALVDNVDVTTSAGTVRRQVVSLGDREVPGERLIIAGGSMRVRHNEGTGTLFDSDLAAIPTSDTDVHGATLYLDTLYVVNTSDGVIALTLVSKTSGLLYLDAVPVQPRDARLFSLGGMRSVGGVSWLASAAGLNGQVRGNL